MYKLLCLSIFISFSLIAGSVVAEPVSSQENLYSKTKKHNFPLLVGREYVDLSDLAGENESLKTIQKDYERFHLVGSTSMNVAMIYIVAAGLGLIKPKLTESFVPWIPWVGFMGVGLTFGMMSRSKLDDFSKAHNTPQQTSMTSFQMDYIWRF